MQRIGDRFSKENKTLFLRLTLVVLMGLSVFGVVHPANRGIGQSVMAARPAFDGTDTDLVEIRPEEPDVPTHYAEMGNLLSFHPKIHSLRTDTKKFGSLPNCHRIFGVRRCSS